MKHTDRPLKLLSKSPQAVHLGKTIYAVMLLTGFLHISQISYFYFSFVLSVS